MKRFFSIQLSDHAAVIATFNIADLGSIAECTILQKEVSSARHVQHVHFCSCNCAALAQICEYGVYEFYTTSAAQEMIKKHLVLI